MLLRCTLLVRRVRGQNVRPDQFLVRTYARDTGAILAALTAPVFVKGRRWGAVLLGWNVET